MGVKDSTWLNPTGDEMKPEDWHNAAARCFGLLLDGRAQTSGIRQRGSESTLLLITNAHHDVVLFTLPKVAGGRDWRRLVDTNQPEEDDDPDRPVLFKFGQQYQVTGRSLLLLVLRQARSQRRRGGGGAPNQNVIVVTRSQRANADTAPAPSRSWLEARKKPRLGVGALDGKSDEGLGGVTSRLVLVPLGGLGAATERNAG